MLAKLARGDIGDLFLARSLGAGGFEKLVIIKRIHREFMRDPAIAELFMTEARIAARIEHPNVRMVYEIGQAQDHHYIALEYLEGVPLVEVLLGRRREKRLADTRLISSLLVQTCEGLHMAHTLSGLAGGLVHGDLNPRSIFITASGTAKILDFDIVEMRGVLAERHGFVRRTSAYMSPEEVRTGQSDFRSDIFSMGVVIWEALTGRRLFRQDTRERTMQAIDRGHIPSAQKYRPELSDAVNATIMRALSRDPDLRFQTARELATALERAVQAEGPPLTPVNIASLIENTFADRLQQQRAFVRTARNSESAPHSSRRQAVDESETVVTTKVPDPDDWNTDTAAATRVAPDLAALLSEDAQARRDDTAPKDVDAAIQDPFNEITASVDYSTSSEAPQWTDTRNLVLSEMGLDVDDDPETGAVDIDLSDCSKIENSDTSNAPTTPATRGIALQPAAAPAITAAPHAVVPRIPSTIDPNRSRPPRTGSRVPSTIDPSEDRRLATINSFDSRRPSSLGADNAQSVKPSARKRLRYIFLAATIIALAGGAYLRFGVTQEASRSKNAQLAAPGPQPEQAHNVRPTKNSGAGAAASILAAADEISEEVRVDAGREAVNGNLPTSDEELSGSDEELSGSDEELSGSDEEADELTLEKDERAQRKKKRLASERADAKKREKAERRRSPKKRRVEQDSPKEATAPRAPKGKSNEPGFLTLNANPYATVFVDGKKIGFTPIVKLELKPGRHKIKLINSAGGESTAINITIASDKVFRKNVTF